MDSIGCKTVYRLYTLRLFFAFREICRVIMCCGKDKMNRRSSRAKNALVTWVERLNVINVTVIFIKYWKKIKREKKNWRMDPVNSRIYKCTRSIDRISRTKIIQHQGSDLHRYRSASAKIGHLIFERSGTTWPWVSDRALSVSGITFHSSRVRKYRTTKFVSHWNSFYSSTPSTLSVLTFIAKMGVLKLSSVILRDMLYIANV